jgi:hypothetical protein
MFRPRDDDRVGLLELRRDLGAEFLNAVDVPVLPDAVAGALEHARTAFRECLVLSRVAEEDAPHSPSGRDKLRYAQIAVYANQS